VSDVLGVKCRVTTAGGWLDLMSGPYRLSGDAFGEQAQAWRRQDVANPFVEGTWTVGALRENVVEQLNVWVRGETTADTHKAVRELLEALSQLNYGLEVQFDDVKYFYQCYVADVSVKASRELRFARMAQVSASVPRHPNFESVVVA